MLFDIVATVFTSAFDSVSLSLRIAERFLEPLRDNEGLEFTDFRLACDLAPATGINNREEINKILCKWDAHVLIIVDNISLSNFR